MRIAIILYSFCFLEAASWNYLNTDWGASGNSCDGQQQSPIDIDTKKTTQMEFPPFEFSSEWSEPMANFTNLENTGHGYKVSDDEGTRTVTGGGLNGTYTLLQFHFHQGDAQGGKGSEHTIDGRQYDAEVHFVTYNPVNYSSGEYGYLAVLGFMIEASDDLENPGSLDNIFDQIATLTASGASYNFTDNEIKVDTIAPIYYPGAMDGFYRYPGSLTTPPCDEVVVWTVFDYVLTVSRSQLNKLFDGQDSEGNALIDTYRPVQPLNGRTVYRTVNAIQDASATIFAPVATIMLLLAAKFF